MKRTLTVLLCVGLMLLAIACGADPESPIFSEIEEQSEGVFSSQSAFSNSSYEDAGNGRDGESLVDDGYFLVSDFMTPGDFENFCLREGVHPNTAIPSPDGEQLIFFDMEEEGAVDLWSVKKGEEPQRILSSERQLAHNAIKSAIWYNNDTVLLIIGYRFETVSPGGDVYRLDMASTTLHLLYRPEGDREQVVSMAVQDMCLVAEVASYDEDYTDFVMETRTVPLLVENAAIAHYWQEPMPEDSAGLAVVLDLDSGAQAEAATVETMDLDASGESILIIPRYAGSDIRLYSVKHIGDSFVNSGWINAVYNTADDYILQLNMELPETVPTVKVVINCFGQMGEFLIDYDGQDGNRIRVIQER